MVKKLEETWASFNIIPNSASCVQKYLNMCEQWLIKNEGASKNPHSFVNVTPELTNYSTCIGMYETDIRHINKFKCAICDSYSDMNSGKCVVANPFTRAQYMVLCHDCNHEIFN